MREKEILNKFQNADKTIVIDEKRKRDTLLLLRENIDNKQISITKSRKRILINQVQYMDKTVMGIQLLLCAILLLVMAVLKWQEMSKQDMIAFSMVLSGMLGIISIVEVGRIFFSGIAELSESCYFNVRQIVALHMALSGIINLTVLMIGIVFASSQWKIDLLQIGLYVMVPFVGAECCCLGILLSEAGRKNIYLLIMTGIFLVIFYLILASIPDLFQVTAVSAWGAAFAIGLALLGIQVKILFRRMNKGEMICMN